MKRLSDYIAESAFARENPAAGDALELIFNEELCVGTQVYESSPDHLIFDADETLISLLEHCGCALEEDDSDNEIDESLSPMVPSDSASPIPGRHHRDIDEAKYQGREVKLGKPMAGDVKKYKVYVRDPKTGNIKKVNFGDKKLSIKRDDPKRRKNFRARHNCAQAKDRTSAKYWSCRMWSRKPVSKILRGK